MNYTVVSAKIVCNFCSHVQWADAKHCSACGVSFVWGEPDAWHSQALTTASSLLPEVDDDIDADIDKHFAELRKTAKSKKYKMTRVKDDIEYEGLFKGYKGSPWKVITFFCLVAIAIGLALDKIN